MQKKVALYYLILVALVGGKLVLTLFQGSTLVFDSQKIHALKAQRQVLSTQRMSLQSQLSAKRSLVTLADSPSLAEYQPIGTPFMIDGSATTVANAL